MNDLFREDQTYNSSTFQRTGYCKGHATHIRDYFLLNLECKIMTVHLLKACAGLKNNERDTNNNWETVK